MNATKTNCYENRLSKLFGRSIEWTWPSYIMSLYPWRTTSDFLMTPALLKREQHALWTSVFWGSFYKVVCVFLAKCRRVKLSNARQFTRMVCQFQHTDHKKVRQTSPSISKEILQGNFYLEKLFPDWGTVPQLFSMTANDSLSFLYPLFHAVSPS